MNTWKTNNTVIHKVLGGRSNSFLVSKEDKHVLIDTGWKHSRKKLTSILDYLLKYDDLAGLILTHAHFDHTENAAYLKDRYKCQVFIHESEADYLKQGTGQMIKGTTVISKILVDVLGNLLRKNFFTYVPVEPVCEIYNDTDLKDLGIPLCIIHTPGHSKGSISIIVDDEIAIVGDTMHGVFPNSAFPPFAIDTEKMAESWGELLKTNSKIFLPGHGGEISRELLKKEYEKRKTRI